MRTGNTLSELLFVVVAAAGEIVVHHKVMDELAFAGNVILEQDIAVIWSSRFFTSRLLIRLVIYRVINGHFL